MGAEPRITGNVVAVLAAMVEDPQQPWYGLELARDSNIGSGTIYAVLRRLERAGWVEAAWEDIDPVAEGRPARRLYRLASKHLPQAVLAVDEHRYRIAPRASRPAVRPGGLPA